MYVNISSPMDPMGIYAPWTRGLNPEAMPNDEFIGTILRMAARDRYTLVEVGVAGGVAGSRPKSLSEHVQVRWGGGKTSLNLLGPSKACQMDGKGLQNLQTP